MDIYCKGFVIVKVFVFVVNWVASATKSKGQRMWCLKHIVQ